MDGEPNLINEVKDILTLSQLSESEREMWLTRLQAVPEVFLATFIELYKADAALLQQETKMLKEKIAAYDDPKKFKEIVEREKKLLQDTLTDLP
jgi:ribosomal protein L20